LIPRRDTLSRAIEARPGDRPGGLAILAIIDI
jgi:hypothetical protein